MYLKFGIGRTTSDAAHEIRDGKIMKRVKHSYADKTVNFLKYYQTFLDYIGMNSNELR